MAGSMHPAVMWALMAVVTVMAMAAVHSMTTVHSMAVMVAVVLLPLVSAVPLSTAVITLAFAVPLALAPLAVLALGSVVAVPLLLLPLAILGEQSHHAHPGLDGGLEIASLPFAGGHGDWCDEGGHEGGEATGGNRGAGRGEHEKTPQMSGDVDERRRGDTPGFPVGKPSCPNLAPTLNGQAGAGLRDRIV
jgi:hypothetical protein